MFVVSFEMGDTHREGISGIFGAALSTLLEGFVPYYSTVLPQYPTWDGKGGQSGTGSGGNLGRGGSRSMLTGGQTPFQLTSKMEAFLKEGKLLLADQSVAICFSGGQDSTATWFSLLQIEQEWGLALGLLHFQHLWQRSSFYALNQLIGVALLSKEPLFVPLAPFSVPSEERARHWRYQAGYRSSHFYGFQSIALGHTATDSVETILLSLMRGSRRGQLSKLAPYRWGHNPYPASLHLTLFSRVRGESFHPLERRANQLRLLRIAQKGERGYSLLATSPPRGEKRGGGEGKSWGGG